VSASAADPARPASPLPDLAPGTGGGAALFDLERLAGIRLRVEVPLGHAHLEVRDVLALRPGTVLPLDRTTGEPLEIVVNGTTIARGEVRVQGERFAIRVTEILGAPRRNELTGEEMPRAETAPS
jgi:flagellar motor switch protein FliN/FliY